MNEMQKKRIDKQTTIGVILILVLALAALICLGLARKLKPMWLGVIFGITTFVVWILHDIVAVVRKHEFETKTAQQRQSYLIYCVIDLASYAGLVWFAVDAKGMYGAYVFVITVLLKRRYLEQYKEDASVDSEEEESQEE